MNINFFNKKVLLLISIICFSGLLNAQEIKVKATIDTNNVLIGDQIKLKLEFLSNKKVNLAWPSIPDSVGSIEFISKSKIDTISENNRFQLTQQMVLTSFDSGYFSLPAFAFTVQKDGNESLFQTDSLILKFRTVAVDTSKAFKDIKPPLEEPVTFDEYLIYILIGLGVLILAGGGYFLWKKYKRRGEPVPAYDPKIPPHVIALEALKQLDIEKLWQKGQTKLYYTRLTEIVRLYIERYYKIPALEEVSEEIISELSDYNIHPQALNKIKIVLEIADLVKFAKHNPIPDENTLCMNNAIEFVNLTKPFEVSASQEGR